MRSAGRRGKPPGWLDELREQAIALAEAGEKEKTDGYGDPRAWRAVADLPDDALARVPYKQACAQGWTANDILGFAGATVPPALDADREPRRRGEGARTKALRKALLLILDEIDGSMSTRQVFYQCVSVGAVANAAAECLRVGRLLVKMRREGTVDYARIVDRTRARHLRASWAGVEDILRDTALEYRRDYWRDQTTIPMIACEKQALEGIFEEAVDEYGVPLYVLRGFNSESFEYEWAEDIREITESGRQVVIYYFGDHDPSGMCIESNSRGKLEGFGATFTWRRAGLLWEDFERFDLVNVPVKRGDPRAKGYLIKFGDRAAELDALHPDELRRRIERVILRHIDHWRWDRIARVEKVERQQLHDVTDRWSVAVKATRGRR